MNFRNLSTREWITIIVGGSVLAAFLLWFYVIDAGSVKLERDRKALLSYRKKLQKATIKLRRRSELDEEYQSLVASFSNQLNKIGDMQIPDDIDDLLQIEFDRMDRMYGSSIGQTRFYPMETNDVFNLLKYGLSQVQCDWRSLNAALYLIENSGQLVGFDTLTISADPRDKRNVKARVQMNVKSFIFPDKGTRPWRMPDYTKIESSLGPDIFQMPESMIPPQKVGGGLKLAEGELPKWSRAIKLTGIVTFPGKLHAVFRDKAKKKEYRIGVNGVISNTEATITAIDPVAELVTFVENGEEFEMPLRKYRAGMYETPEPMSFAPGMPRTRLRTADTARADEREDDYEERELEEGEAPEVVTEKTEVPRKYEKTLGSYSECSLKMGAFLNRVDNYTKRRLRLESDYGMVVTRIHKHGRATKAGLERMDVILNIGGKRVDSNVTFTYAMNEAYSKSKAIPVTIIRKNAVKKLMIVLE